MRDVWREQATALALAWGFLTRVPPPRAVAATPERMAAALRYLPLVGALIGLVAAAVLLTAAAVLPFGVAVLLSTAATCLLTGALHEDGLADTLDGAGAGGDVARRLAIMRDSRIGTFGALGLGLTLALKGTSLAALSPGAAAAALVAGHGASRLSAVLVIATSRYARESGTGGFTAAGLRGSGLVVALGTGVICLLVLWPAAGAAAIPAALAGLLLGHGLARGLFERQLGGYTGDGLGATQQLSELGLYLGLLAWL